jgi:hypothetical protein
MFLGACNVNRRWDKSKKILTRARSNVFLLGGAGLPLGIPYMTASTYFQNTSCGSFLLSDDWFPCYYLIHAARYTCGSDTSRYQLPQGQVPLPNRCFPQANG